VTLSPADLAGALWYVYYKLLQGSDKALLISLLDNGLFLDANINFGQGFTFEPSYVMHREYSEALWCPWRIAT